MLSQIALRQYRHQSSSLMAAVPSFSRSQMIRLSPAEMQNLALPLSVSSIISSVCRTVNEEFTLLSA